MTHLTIESPGGRVSIPSDANSTAIGVAQFPARYVAEVAHQAERSGPDLTRDFLAYADEALEWAAATLPAAVESLPEV